MLSAVQGIALVIVCAGILPAEVPPAAKPAEPMLQRFFFHGTYQWGQELAISCTLKRSDPKSAAFDAHWLAYFPGQGGDGWHHYQGPLTLDFQKKTVSGSAACPGQASGTFTGSFRGEFPNISLELTYTGGSNGPPVMRLQAGPPTDEAYAVDGAVTQVAAGDLVFTVSGLRLGKDGRPLPLPTAAKPKPGEKPVPPNPSPWQVVVASDTEIRVGKRRGSIGLLGPGLELKVAGVRVGEGILAKQVLVAEPPVYIGTLEAVDAGAGIATTRIRGRNERAAETQAARLQLGAAVDVFPPAGKAKTLAQAIAALQTGMTFEAGIHKCGEAWLVVWLRASQPRTAAGPGA